MNGDPHTVSIKAKQDSNILILESGLLDSARQALPELEHYMSEYEDYIENWGLPYCDYKIYRHKKKGKHDIFLKFRVGMHRILNIIKSSKTEIHINDMMKRVQDQIKMEERKKKNRMRNRQKGSVMDGDHSQQIQDLQNTVSNLEDKLTGMEKMLIQISSNVFESKKRSSIPVRRNSEG